MAIGFGWNRAGRRRLAAASRGSGMVAARRCCMVRCGGVKEPGASQRQRQHDKKQLRLPARGARQAGAADAAWSRARAGGPARLEACGLVSSAKSVAQWKRQHETRAGEARREPEPARATRATRGRQHALCLVRCTSKVRGTAAWPRLALVQGPRPADTTPSVSLVSAR